MLTPFDQLVLLEDEPATHATPDAERLEKRKLDLNQVDPADRAFHDWYRFVLSYPPHLVRDYFRDFGLRPGQVVLDPFTGTGTTVLEARLNRLTGAGIEANPLAHFAATVKTDWSIRPVDLRVASEAIATDTLRLLRDQGIYDDDLLRRSSTGSLRELDAETAALLIRDSISPLPLHKTLTLRDAIMNDAPTEMQGHLLLALGKALVTSIGNLKFGPEVGIGRIKHDAPVVASWLANIDRMACDLESIQSSNFPDARIALGDAREPHLHLEPESIDAVITSPPYPNEKDYTRTTRLESVLLGFYDTQSGLRSFKKTLLRSNTRGVYKDDDDHLWVKNNAQIQDLAHRIEQRRIELGKTSGFEKMYARATLLYFGGMAKHLAQLRVALKPGARLAYVVGDQASYFRILIRTGEILAEIAQELGYELERIDLFRTRFATATQAELREEVVVLCWPG